MVNFLQQSFPKDTFKKDSIKVANYKKQNQKQISIAPDIIYQGSHTVIFDINKAQIYFVEKIEEILKYG